MYTKPIIYKIYSVLILATAVLGLIGSIVSFGALANMIEKYLMLSKDFSTFTSIIFIILSIPTLFFSYVEFSAMFTFAEMIEHEQSNSMFPFQKRSFALPAKFYRGYGSVVFYVVLFIEAVVIIATVISASIEKQAFICLPLIPVAISLITIVITYIIYYAKFKAMGDLLEIVSNKEVSQATKESLKENKPNMLRGYCAFLFGVAIASFVAIIVLIFITFGSLSNVFGVGGAIIVSVTYILMGVVIFLCLSVNGCYFDNIAKMLEHHMIKHKMI